MATAVTPPFAQAIADMVAAVAPMLGNVTATIDGEPTTGIYTNEHSYATQGQLGYEAIRPMLTCPTADIPSPAVGAAVCIGEEDFVVFAHEPDGTGLSRLILERA